MTRRIIQYSVFVITWTLQATAVQGQFELTEPEQDSGNSAVVEQKRDVRPSAVAQKGNRQAQAGPAPKTETAATAESVSSESKETAGPRQSIEKPIPQFELLSEDGEFPEFFSGPVPRTKAVGEDASLNDVCHVGKRCWAVGERGVICNSEDGGHSWTTGLTPMECSLRSVCFLTNNIGWVGGIRITANASREAAVLLHTRDGGKTWQDLTASDSSVSQSLPLPAAALPGILHVQYFGLDDVIAITLPVHHRGGNGIFRSTNGGRTWSAIVTDQPAGHWNAANFLSESEGIIVGNHQSYAAVVSNQAVMINPLQPTLREMRGVSLSPNGEGWIVGDGGTILTTGNAGVTWQPPKEEVDSQLAEVLDLHTVSHHGSRVIAGGNPGSVLLRSESGGSEWTPQAVPMSGRINRIRFLSESEVLVVGSLGQILLSVDAGITWRSVRSPELRAGVLNLVTDADRASWQILANASGENGVRSVVLQISQPMQNTAGTSDGNNSAMSERTLLALTQLGGNDTASDWMFPRTRPEHHLSADQLIAEWNRETDGRLRRLLPLRLARDIRNWRPAVIVIEPISDDDAIAAILRDVMAQSIQLAAGEEQDSEVLSQIGLSPWKVARVVSRVPADRRATLSVDDADLLTSLGTTIGLLCDASSRSVSDSLSLDRAVGSRAGYEIVLDQQEAASVQNLIEGLDEWLSSDARRPARIRSREKVDLLRNTVQRAHLEAVALSGVTELTNTEDSLIGALQRVGTSLPETLALKQLKDLANLHLLQNNMESYLAIQQEVIRRYPTSEDARSAAEMLFLFYSSAESRHHRIRSMFKSPAHFSSRQNGSPRRSSEPVPDSQVSVQPEIQAASVQALSADPGNQLAMLHERWDSHAATALRILNSDQKSDVNARSLDPLVQLRQAANLRNQNLNGEQHNLLAEVSQRDDQLGQFAKSEMEVLNSASTPVLPLFNIPRRSLRPFLDGKLTDEIWESAEEISLVPFFRNTASPDSAEYSQQVRPGDTVVSSFVMVTWDEQFLYAAARLEHSRPEFRPVELATHRSHDASHGSRDRVELEFDTDRDFGTSFQLVIDQSGMTSERCWMLSNWNPEWFVAVDSDDSAWRFEAAIPLAELSTPVASPGNLWSIKLRRILPGILQHELVTPGSQVSTNGTGLIRFIRPKVMTRSPSKQ